MVQGMPRRHLFDNGYPVTVATLLAGSEVLLAVARQAVRTSHVRLAMCILRLTESSQRLTASVARHGCSRVDLANSRDNFNYGNAARADQRVAAGIGEQPGQMPACEEPH